MASRKDFAGKKPKSNQSASKKSGAAVAPAEPAAAKLSPSRKVHHSNLPKSPWKLMLASVLAISVISFLLFKLSNVDPREIGENGIAALIEEKIANDTTVIPQEKDDPEAISVQTSQKTKNLATPKPTVVPVSEKSTQAEQKEPYQFYEVLAKNSVKTETIAAYKSTPKTAKLKNKTLLQTGSFRNLKDAQNMKARLLLNNLPNVTVSKTTSNKGVWYRVRTGPFITFNHLKNALVKLNKLKINSLQVRVN